MNKKKKNISNQQPHKPQKTSFKISFQTSVCAYLHKERVCLLQGDAAIYILIICIFTYEFIMHFFPY